MSTTIHHFDGVVVDSSGGGQPAASLLVATAVPINGCFVSSSGSIRNNDAIFDSSVQIDEENTRLYLTRNEWPVGLQQTLINGLKKVPKRFIIVDNSGSMALADGNVLYKGNGVTKTVKCSRWEELANSMRFHAGLAHATKAPTEFRLLNDSHPVTLGVSKDEESTLEMLLGMLDSSPSGGTPLCKHISHVISEIRAMEHELRQNRQKVVVIIATDGQASDGELTNAMRPLQRLPVWVVVRLCTDNERIVKYWNGIDSQLELEMDVLDDIFSESQEVSSLNPWLTYGEPLHRMREFGISLKEMDLIDEAELSSEQMRSVAAAM